MQILPAEQTFGSTLGQALGQGFSGGMQAGLSSSLDQYFAQKKQAADAQRKESQLQKFFESEEGKSLSPDEKAVYMLSAKVPGLEGIGKEIISSRAKQREMQQINNDIQSLYQPEGEEVAPSILPRSTREENIPAEEGKNAAIPISKPKEATTKIGAMSEDQLKALEAKGGKYAQAAKQERTFREKAEKARIAEEKPGREYLDEVAIKYDRAKKLEPVFTDLEEKIKSGGADFMTMGNWADILGQQKGLIGSTLSGMLKANESGDTGAFRALSKQLLDEMKEIFGGQIRVSEFNAFLSMIPQLGKSREANLAAVGVLRKASQMSKRFYETAQGIVDENEGKIPKNLADLTRKKLDKEIAGAAAEMKSTIDSSKKNIEKQNSQQENYVRMKNSKGELVKVRQDLVKDRLSKGYTQS